MKLTIRTKLLIGFTLLLVLSSLIQAFTFSITRQYISSQIGHSQEVEARKGVTDVQEFFTNLSLNSYGIARLYERTTPTASNAAEKIEPVAKYIIQNNAYIKTITILSPRGRELAIFNAKGDLPIDKLNYEVPSEPFDSAVKGTTGISEVYFLEQEPGPHLDMFSPIFAENGTVVGIIKMQISLQNLSEAIAHINVGEDGYVYIVDGKGRLIAHQSESFVMKRPTLTSRKIISNALNNITTPIDEATYSNEKNISVVGTAIKVPGYNWVVVFEQPVSAAFGFLDFIRNLFLVTVIGSFISLLIVALFLSENLTSSIRKLQKSTKLIEEGKLNASVIIKSGDEIETLSYSFASMVNQLLQRENSLRREKQEMDVLFQSLSDGAAALDENNSIIMFNKTAERITGFNAISVFGRNVDMVLHFYEDHELVPFSLYSNQTEERAQKLREKGLIMTNQKGERISVTLAVSPVIFGDQKTGSIITFHDTSKEHELEEMKLDFVSMAAHELRTPLTAIRGYASLLQMELIKNVDETGKQMINRLVVSSENLGNLIDNLLSVSRIERNTFSVDAKPADLTNTIKGVIDNIKQQAETKKQTLRLSLPPELPIVMADAFRIGQVLLNLVANAVNYVPEGGEIHVTAEKKSGYLQISVADNGHGIPKEALSKLFTKFFRVSGALEQGSKGTGLGLFISKSIIEMHRGKIWVESEEGKGATFTFVIPIATPEEIKLYQEQKSKATLTVKSGQGIIIKNKK